MKIAIIGGGNMGSVLATRFSQQNDVILYVNTTDDNLQRYKCDMKVYSEDSNTYFTARIKRITNSLDMAIRDAEWIFITYPPFLFENLAEKMVPLLQTGQHLVGIPGSGGFEIFFRTALDKGCTITGLQRVHSVARIIERGLITKESGIRSAIKVASIPAGFNNEAAHVLEELYEMPVVWIDNYLNITLINSNPILHTSRLYSIYRDCVKIEEYDSVPLFYEEWSKEASEVLVKMDKELFNMFKELKGYGIQINHIESILDHYESNDVEQLTRKIRAIKSLKGLPTPSVKLESGKYIPDFKSRYFVADFSFGLDILIAFSKILGSESETMRKVSDWYHSVSDDMEICSLRKFGINTIEDVVKYYL